MIKTTVWAMPVSCGDGSATILWFITENQAQKFYESDDEPFAEDGIIPVETFVGSNIYNKAVRQENEVIF